MYNVAYEHLYIAHMFSQFKENMEINQGINGPNQMKNIKKEMEKGLDSGSTPKNIVHKEQH